MSITADIKDSFFRFLDNQPSVSVICFDFFDTLVYRTVAPEHTKKLASKQLGIFLKDPSPANEIYKIRRDLEAQLCRENALNGMDPEFNMADFATAFLEKLTKRFSGWPCFLTEALFFEFLIAIELKIETRVQRVCTDTAELLPEIRERGLHTAIVSDFYVPTPFFNRFLDFHGLSGFFDEIFVSSDYGLTKASGRLYDKIVEHLGCLPENMVMVGDNAHSDGRMATEKGIQAFYIDREDRKAFYDRWEKRKTSRPRTGSRLAKRIDAVAVKQGGGIFPETGVTLWRFTYRLFERLLQDGVRDVFFFSKEGEFLKKLFDQFQEEQFGRCVIRSHYLLVSRKSSFICSLRSLEEENFFRIFHQYREMAPRDFLLSLNFLEDDAVDLCRIVSVDYEKREPHFGTSAAFFAIVGSDRFAELYETTRLQQRFNFLAYLNGFGVDIRKEGLHIVDVGWRGSIQDNIYFTLSEKVAVSGYYIGLLQPTNTVESNRKTGILFSEYPVETPFFEVYNSNRSFFEMLLDATHGSADGYHTAEQYRSRSSGVPFKETSPSGLADVVVNTLDLPEERRLFDEHIQPIQDRILKINREINHLTAVTDSPIPDAEWFARRHARMMYRPTGREVGFFENLYHLENFGIFEFTDFKGGENLSLAQRHANFKKVLREPVSVLQTGIWAPVALKRLGLDFYHRRFGAGCHKRVFSDGYDTANLRRKEKVRGGWLRLKPKKKIKIAFLLGIPEINGGTYVVFEHASRLMKKGYRVFILTEEKIDPQRYDWHPDADGLTWSTYVEAEDVHFDFAVATWWMSAFFLGRVNAATYLYFIQSIETRFFPSEKKSSYTEIMNRQLADNTYAIPLPVITEASWIQTYLQENYGRKSALVLNGIRKDIYTPSGDCHTGRLPGKVRALVEGPVDVGYKNVLRTIELCRASDVDEVWLLTSSPVDTFPGVDRVFSQVPIWETPPVYRSCDVLVKLSYIEGMFGPPLEMFHCGGTAIVYRVTGHDEYIRDDVNGYVIQPDDEESVVARLNLLKRDPEVLERLKRSAHETASQWPDWQTASDRFENALDQYKTRLWPNRSYLNRITDQMWGKARHDIQWLRSLPDYRKNKPVTENCQVFWHADKGFNEKDSAIVKFETRKWVTLETGVSLPSGQIHLRIDPCMQAGVVIFEHIRIGAANDNRPICRFSAETNWKGLEVSGTASVIEAESRLVVDANGEDPQCLLPPFELDEGDTEIAVELSMLFLPFPIAPLELKPYLNESESNQTDIRAHG